MKNLHTQRKHANEDDVELGDDVLSPGVWVVSINFQTCDLVQFHVSFSHGSKNGAVERFARVRTLKYVSFIKAYNPISRERSPTDRRFDFLAFNAAAPKAASATFSFSPCILRILASTASLINNRYTWTSFF